MRLTAESWAWTSLGVEEQFLIYSDYSSCLSPGRVKKLQKFINFGLKVDHSANLEHSKSCDSCEMYKISKSRNGNDLRQLSFWYRALSCGAEWFTKGVYIWVTDIFAYRSAHNRLQNSPYFCVLKYARAVKQKVWNEAENRERDWGDTLKIRTVRLAYVIFVRNTRFSQPRAIPNG